MTELVRHHRTVILLATGFITLAAIAGFLLVQRHADLSQWQDGTIAGMPQAETPSSGAGEQVNTNTGYVVIKEWGVRVRPDAQLGLLAYKIMPENAGMIGLSTNVVAALDPACDVEAEGRAPLGMLQRTSEPLKAPNGSVREPLKVIGRHFYYFTGPQALCPASAQADTAANAELVSRQTVALSRTMQTLEASE